MRPLGRGDVPGEWSAPSDSIWTSVPDWGNDYDLDAQLKQARESVQRLEAALRAERGKREKADARVAELLAGAANGSRQQQQREEQQQRHHARRA